MLSFAGYALALQQFYSGIQAGFVQPTGTLFSQARGAPTIGLYSGLSGLRMDWVLGAQTGLFSVARKPVDLGSGTLAQGDWFTQQNLHAWTRWHLPFDLPLSPELGLSGHAWAANGLRRLDWGPYIGCSLDWNWLGLEQASRWQSVGHSPNASGLAVAWEPYLGQGGGTFSIALRWGLPGPSLGLPKYYVPEPSRRWSRALIGAEDLQGIKRKGLYFHQVIFRGTKLQGAILEGATFKDCLFEGVNLDSLYCKQCLFENTDLVHPGERYWHSSKDNSMKGMRFEGTRFVESRIDLRSAHFDSCSFQDASVGSGSLNVYEGVAVKGGDFSSSEGSLVVDSRFKDVYLHIGLSAGNNHIQTPYASLQTYMQDSIDAEEHLYVGSGENAFIRGLHDSISQVEIGDKQGRESRGIRLKGQRIHTLAFEKGAHIAGGVFEDLDVDKLVLDSALFDSCTFRHIRVRKGLWHHPQLQFERTRLENIQLDSLAKTYELYCPDRQPCVPDSEPWKP